MSGLSVNASSNQISKTWLEIESNHSKVISYGNLFDHMTLLEKVDRENTSKKVISLAGETLSNLDEFLKLKGSESFKIETRKKLKEDVERTLLKIKTGSPFYNYSLIISRHATPEARWSYIVENMSLIETLIIRVNQNQESPSLQFSIAHQIKVLIINTFYALKRVEESYPKYKLENRMKIKKELENIDEAIKKFMSAV